MPPPGYRQVTSRRSEERLNVPSRGYPASRPTSANLTVLDVAKLFAITEPCVLAWVASGELKAVNVARRATAKRPYWRISRGALEAFEAARSQTPAAAPKARRRRPADVVEFYG